MKDTKQKNNRSYSDRTLKVLYGKSGNQCAFPDCSIELINNNNAANSNIAHIEAANEGGPRYNSSMTNEERNDQANLILLCPSHHRVTDNESIYTVEVLKKMREDHEKKVQTSTNPIQSRPTVLADLIKYIASSDIEYSAEKSLPSFDIDEKITYNKVIRYRHIIEEYAVYQAELQVIYTEFEEAGDSKVASVYNCIKKFYLVAKGKILNGDSSLENIQYNADDLMDDVKKQLIEFINTSPNNDLNICQEDFDLSLTKIMVDAFMMCKILERPK
jgi:hypothetical protein